MAVYTKTGDKGTTGTFLGKRVSKSSKLIETIGSIDELNSYLGIVGGLKEIQKKLFTINAILSGADLVFSDKEAKKLEKEIDLYEKSLPKQTNFLIYGGTQKSKKLYFARSIARRAERNFVSLNFKIRIKNKELPIYLNRLSDYLFILARHYNFRRKRREIEWKV